MRETKHFAVFGNPVLHSKSPVIFNTAFKKNNISATYLRILPKSAPDILQIIKNIPLSGANITAPFKQLIVPLLDELSPEVQATGAVNTIVNSNNKLKGYNTDVDGVLNSLRTNNIQIESKNCLILGAGGAARAAAYALKQAKASVLITNRTLSKATELATLFNCKVAEWQNFDTSKHFDIIISTLLPEVTPPFISKLKFDVLLDASYQESRISIWAKKTYSKVISGELWLLYQALSAYKIFTNQNITAEIMSERLKQPLSKHNLVINRYSEFLPYIKFIESDLLIVAENDIEFEKIKHDEITPGKCK